MKPVLFVIVVCLWCVLAQEEQVVEVVVEEPFRAVITDISPTSGSAGGNVR